MSTIFEKLSHAHPELASPISSIANLLQSKLHNEMTIETLALLRLVSSQQDRVHVFDATLAPIARLVNPMSLIDGIRLLGKESTDDPEMVVKYLDLFAEDQISSGSSSQLHSKAQRHTAGLLGKILLAESKLRLDLPVAARSLLDAISKLDTTSVHSEFCRVSAMHAKRVGDFNEFFRQSMQYLKTSQGTPAAVFDVAIAALVGSEIFDFGELLSLAEGLPQWLLALVQAFDKGDVAAFAALHSHWWEVPDLKAHAVSLAQKIAKMALLEISSGKRVLSFAQVAEGCSCSAEDVERVILSGMAAGLVKGEIDQCSGELRIKWVKPRVMGRNRIEGLKNRIEEWSSRVVDVAGRVGAMESA